MHQERQATIFDLEAIAASLREVEAHFDLINAHLEHPREALDPHSVDHLVDGYGFVDELIANGIDIFSLGQLSQFLELNARVLCGRNEQTRLEAAQHLAETDKYFFDNVDGGIRDVVEWHGLHARESPWLRAAGVYIRILSEPELFIEGNHRTGALVMSYVLGRGGCPPFVLTADNAKDYLDWSAFFTTKRKGSLLLRCQMSWLKRRFAEFLTAQADPRFLRTR